MSDDLRHIVRRFNWRQVSTVSEGVKYVRLPGATTVAEFDTHDEAAAYRWAAEQAVRHAINPFRCGLDLADLTHFPGFAFRDYLLDDDVKPAKSDSYAQVRWDVWWEKHSANWSDDRKARIWEALDKVRFHEVTEQPAGETVHVVVEAMAGHLERPPYWLWEQRTSRIVLQFGGTEGGRPLRAFRWRENAEACRQLLTDGADPDNPRVRHIPVEFLSPVRATRKQPADEAHTVPLAGGDVTGARVWVVCRVGFSVSDHNPPVGIETYTTGEMSWGDLVAHEDFDYQPMRSLIRYPRLIPEAAFTQRETAETDSLRRERLVRRLVNPFLVCSPGRDVALGSWWASGATSEQRARWWAANIVNADEAVFDEAWTAAVKDVALYHVVEIEIED